MKAALITIHGRVQGVGYRDWLVKHAIQRDITGWVRNRNEGTVEALISGPKFDELLELCAKGPPMAAVTHIDLIPAEPTPEPAFQRLPNV